MKIIRNVFTGVVTFSCLIILTIAGLITIMCVGVSEWLKR